MRARYEGVLAGDIPKGAVSVAERPRPAWNGPARRWSTPEGVQDAQPWQAREGELGHPRSGRGFAVRGSCFPARAGGPLIPYRPQAGPLIGPVGLPAATVAEVRNAKGNLCGLWECFNPSPDEPRSARFTIPRARRSRRRGPGVAGASWRRPLISQGVWQELPPRGVLAVKPVISCVIGREWAPRCAFLMLVRWAKQPRCAFGGGHAAATAETPARKGGGSRCS